MLTLTLGECVTSLSEVSPDQPALRAQAYEGAKGGTRLPGLETYSSDQLFFVAFAYQHCAAADYGAQEESRRVHAAVRNLDAFGRAFACDPGAPMNPTQKCSYF